MKYLKTIGKQIFDGYFGLFAPIGDVKPMPPAASRRNVARRLSKHWKRVGARMDRSMRSL